MVITISFLKDVYPTNISLYFALKDFYGNIYNFGEEKFLINSPLKITRNLSMPETAKEGQYIFYARVSDDENIALDSDVFEVGVRFRVMAFLKSSFIFLLILFLCIIAVILMIIYRREREKERILGLYLMLNELKNLIEN